MNLVDSFVTKKQRNWKKLVYFCNNGDSVLIVHSARYNFLSQSYFCFRSILETVSVRCLRIYLKSRRGRKLSYIGPLSSDLNYCLQAVYR